MLLSVAKMRHECLRVAYHLLNCLSLSMQKNVSHAGRCMCRRCITEEKHLYNQVVRSLVPYSAELTSSLEHDYTFFYYTASILALIATAIYTPRQQQAED